jgi:hypothetical protein
MEEILLTEKPVIDDIKRIDFTMVKLKLRDPHEGQGWTEEECDIAEEEYIKFLALKRAYPEIDIVPNKMVDMIWHQHILDTKKYAEDCDMIFGYFLHHYPYFGMNGPTDAQNLADAFEETKELYRLHFKKDYASQSSKCKSTPTCRTQCKPMKCR